MTEADKDFFIRLLSGVVALATPHNGGEDWRETAAYAEKLLRNYVGLEIIDAQVAPAASDLELL